MLFNIVSKAGQASCFSDQPAVQVLTLDRQFQGFYLSLLFIFKLVWTHSSNREHYQIEGCSVTALLIQDYPL